MNRLKLTRLTKGKTQHQLMKETGIYFATLSRIEREWVQPTEVQKVKISDALGVTKDWLFPPKKKR